MGMFDSYTIAWGDAAEEAQTKQLECYLARWRVGDRVPLGTMGRSDYADGGERLYPGAHAPFACLVDDSNLGRNWSNEELSLRHFAFGHQRGIFADYAGSMTRDGAVAHAEALSALWTASPYAPGLAHRLGLLLERNNHAVESRERAKASINELFAQWRHSVVEARKPEDPNDKKKSAMSMLFAYRGPDFTGSSRLEIDKAIEDLTRHWGDDMLDFDLPIEPSAAQSPAEHIALKIAACGGGFMGGRSLGAKSPDDIAAESAPDSLEGAPTTERALGLLRNGMWRLFEADALELSADDAFLQTARAEIATLCVSRIGAHWAAAAMARNPKLAFATMDLAHWGANPQAVPLVDWMVVNMGLPTRLVAPLLDTDAGVSDTLAHHCLYEHHAALLPLAIERAGGLGAIKAFEGRSFAEQALRCSNVQMVAEALSSGFLPEKSAAGSPIADVALEAEYSSSRIGMPWQPECPEDLKKSPASTVCAGMLLSAGYPASPSARHTERLKAYMAFYEKAQIAESSQDAADHATPRLRI
jgi:hypothetical protein